MLWRKAKRNKKCWAEEGNVIWSFIVEGYAHRVVFKQRLEGSEGLSHPDVREKSIPHRRRSRCKGSEMEEKMKYFRNSQKASIH